MRLLILIDLDNFRKSDPENERLHGWQSAAHGGVPPVPLPWPLEANTNYPNRATVVVAANEVTDHSIVGANGARPTQFKIWLVSYALAFAARHYAHLVASEYAMVPKAPEAADVALELLAGTTPRALEETFDGVLLYSGDQSLTMAISGVLGSRPDAIPLQRDRPHVPVRWRHRTVRRASVHDPNRHIPDAPPPNDRRWYQWFGPSRTGVVGVARMAECLRGEAPSSIGSNEVFVARPPAGGPEGVRASAVAGVVEVGATLVAWSRLPLSVLQAAPPELWRGVSQGDRTIASASVLSRLVGGQRGASVVTISLRMMHSELVGEIGRAPESFQEEWWWIWDTAKGGVPRALSTAKLRVRVGAQPAFQSILVPSVALPRPVESEVWWAAVDALLQPEPDGVRLRRGLTLTGERAVISRGEDEAYTNAFVPIHAEGVIEELHTWGISLPFAQLRRLPLVVPLTQLTDELQTTLSSPHCPNPPLAAVHRIDNEIQ